MFGSLWLGCFLSRIFLIGLGEVAVDEAPELLSVYLLVESHC